MAKRRRVVIAIVVALATTAGVYADMMPASATDVAPRPWPRVAEHVNPQAASSPGPLLGPAIIDLDLWSAAFLPTTSPEVEETYAAQPPLQLLDHDRSSFDLCLYAFFLTSTLP